MDKKTLESIAVKKSRRSPTVTVSVRIRKDVLERFESKGYSVKDTIKNVIERLSE